MLRFSKRESVSIGEAEVFINDINAERDEITLAIRAPKSVLIRKRR